MNLLNNKIMDNLINELEISFCSQSDLLQINQLVNLSYRGEMSKLGWTTEAYILAGQRTDPTLLSEEFNEPKTLFLKAEAVFNNKKMIIGCVKIKKINDEEYYLGMLTCHPQYQNKKIGSKVLNHIEGYLIKNKVKRIKILVISTRQELISWYERRNYKLTGKTEPFYYQDTRFGIPLKNDLFFVELIKEL